MKRRGPGPGGGAVEGGGAKGSPTASAGGGQSFVSEFGKLVWG